MLPGNEVLSQQVMLYNAEDRETYVTFQLPLSLCMVMECSTIACTGERERERERCPSPVSDSILDANPSSYMGQAEQWTWPHSLLRNCPR